MSDSDIDHAILVFAHYLGIDINKEEDLIYIAEDALLRLPPDWQLGIGEDDNAGIPYFVNNKTGESSWHHPEEKRIAKFLKQEKQRKADRIASRSGSGNNLKKDSERISPRNATSNSPRNQSKNNEKQSTVKSSNTTSNNNANNIKPSQKKFSRDDEDDRADDVEVLDFDESELGDSFHNASKPASSKQVVSKPKELASTTNTANKAKETTTVSAFSMNPSDFFDNDDDVKPLTPDSNWDKVKETNKKVTTASTNVSSAASVMTSKGQDSSIVHDRPSTANDGWKTSKTSSAVNDGRPSTADNPRSGLFDRKGGNPLFDDSSNDLIKSKSDERSTSRGHEDRVTDRSRDDRPVSRGKEEKLAGKDDQQRQSKDNRDEKPTNKVQNDKYATKFQDDRTVSRERDDRQANRNQDDKYSNKFQDDRSASRSKDDKFLNKFQDDHSVSRGREERANNKFTSDAAVKPIKDDDYEKNSIAIEKLELKLRDALDDNASLEKLVKDLRSRRDEEMENLRKYTKRIEEHAAEDRDNRKAAEEKLARLEASNDSKLREIEDESSEKIREQLKKMRAEVEEEWKDRIKTLEKRHQQEIEDVSSSLVIAKKRHEEALKEVEVQKKRVANSREDGRLEIISELEETKQQLVASENQTRLVSTELKKLREDHVALSSKFTNASQQLQIAHADAETSRAAATTAINDYQATNAALVAATQRVSSMDVDLANLRAENASLRRENENLQSNVRKLQQASSITGDRLGVSEMEAKRIKQQSANEISRLSSRIIELEAIVQQQQQQIDKSSTLETEAIREIQRSLTKAEYANTLLTERAQTADQNRQRDAIRIAALEKELSYLEEQQFKKDRLIREESLNTQQWKDKYESLRSQFDAVLAQNTASISAMKSECVALEAKHKADIEKLHQEVCEKLPSLVSAAMQQVDSKWAQRLASEIAACKSQCIVEVEHEWREKLEEYNSIAADRETKLQKLLTEATADVSRLKQTNKSLKHRAAELEDELESLQASLNRSTFKPADTNRTENVAHDQKAMSMSINQQSNEVRGQMDVSLASAEEAASFLLLSQLDAMRQQLGKFLDHGPQSSRLNVSTSFLNNNHNSRLLDVSSSSSLSSLKPPQNIGYGYLSQASNLNTSREVASYSSYDADKSFAAIEDGGYHEGYWKAKYSSN